MQQGELLREKVKEDDPRIELFVNTLVCNRGWLNRREIGRLYRWNTRLIRDLRRMSHGRIIFGQQGFKARCYATPDEITTCTGHLFSQAREMMREGTEILSLAHKDLKAG